VRTILCAMSPYNICIVHERIFLLEEEYPYNDDFANAEFDHFMQSDKHSWDQKMAGRRILVLTLEGERLQSWECYRPKQVVQQDDYICFRHIALCKGALHVYETKTQQPEQAERDYPAHLNGEVLVFRGV
jgi:hypothetical protein